MLLSGPRRVGKSTILIQTADALIAEGVDARSVLYVSLDHPLLKLLSLPEIIRIYHEHIYPQGKPAVLLFDEVQYSGEWELQVKQLIDHHHEYRMLASGSASVIHAQKLTESEVGRWIKVPIPTLSFYEFLRIRKEELPQVAEDLRPSDLFGTERAELAELETKMRPLMPLFQR